MRKYKRAPEAAKETSIDAPLFFQIEDSQEVYRQRKEATKDLPYLGPGKPRLQHQQIAMDNRTFLKCEPKVKEQPFAALKRAFEHDWKRTSAFGDACFDKKNLPQTPLPDGSGPLGEPSLTLKPKEEGHKSLRRVKAVWMDDTKEGPKVVHDVGKFPFPNRTKRISAEAPATPRRSRVNTGRKVHGSVTPRESSSSRRLGAIRAESTLKPSSSRTPR